MQVSKMSLLLLCLCFILLCQGLPSQAQLLGGGRRFRRACGSSDQSRCRIDRLQALEPTRRVESEAGVTEFYDESEDQLECAGVSVARIRIESNGLLLPSYSNSPRMVYIIQGRGSTGVVIPGCPETFQDPQSQESEQRGRSREDGGRDDRRGRREEREESEEEEEEGSFGQMFRDEHQRITRIRQGDVLAIPAGVPFWTYNDGETPLTAVAVYDVTNNANQLDPTFRHFLLAGSRKDSRGRQQYRESETESESEEEERGSRGRGRRDEGEDIYNILSGFDTELLAEAIGVSRDTVQKLQGRNDRRGNIVRVKRGGLRMLKPTQRQSEEEERGQREREDGNGLDEALCSMKMRENIAEPMKADLYTPNGGRITVLNSQKLPILKLIQMSANRGVMRRNAILAPHWSINAHAVVYATSGRARLQIVNNEGRKAFDGELRRGQLVVVPQNFAVLAQSRSEGFSWISFQTNENAMNTPVVGKTSALRGMPVDVLANAYGISKEEARRLKFVRGQEMAIFSPMSRSRVMLATA